MKICLVGTLPEAERDIHKGPERTTIGLAEALSARGHDVQVIADEGSPTTVDVPASILDIRSPPGIARALEFALRARVAIDSSPFDIVHAWRSVFNPDILSLHSVAMAEQVEAKLPGTFSRRFLMGAKLERHAKRIASGQATRTVVTAPSNEADAERFGLNVDDLVPVGVSESFLQQDASADGPDVFCLGRIEARKQQGFVVEETPDRYEISLAGPKSDESYASKIADLERYWRGKLSPKELQHAYQTASVFVLPSVFEGFGLTAVEAMAAGTPAVVADTCGIADLVTEHDLGAVYTFNDGDAYRDALETVFSDRDGYAERAKAFVEEELLWQHIADRYESVYEAAVTA